MQLPDVVTTDESELETDQPGWTSFVPNGQIVRTTVLLGTTSIYSTQYPGTG